jgi:hypothetical protein
VTKTVQEPMGKIITTLVITNRTDEAIATRGGMTKDQVRVVELNLELPGGRSPLLGVIPLEALGIELDLQKQVLKILPISPTQTYLTIL